MVPKEKTDEWWVSFVQKYYWDPQHQDIIYRRWEIILRLSIGDLVSKRKRSGKKPDFIGLADWNIMLDTWEEEPHQKRSKTNSQNASSDPDGLGSHRHTSGAKPHIRVAHEMAVDADGVAPPITEVVRKTHTRKDGTIIDKRAEALLKAAEELAMRSQESAATEGTPNVPSSQELTAAYIKTTKNNKGRVYGIGSIQFLDANPNEATAVSLLRSVKTDIQLTKLKEEIAGMKQGLEVLLRMNGVDPVTYEPVARESAASASATARSFHSESSQQANDLD